MRVLDNAKQALAAILLFSSLGEASSASAARKKRPSIPSWDEIAQAAMETFFEEVVPTERLIAELNDSAREAKSLSSPKPDGTEPLNLAGSMIDISDPNLSCDYVVNQLILHITQFKSIFYFLVNGWYLGQLGDYASCRTFTNNGQYVLATIKGEYTGKHAFTRGSYGKYIDFSTQMGLCIPKQCSLDNVKTSIEPLLLRYASEANWENPSVDYVASWQYEHDTARSFDTGKIVGISIFGFCLLVVSIGSCVELSSIGDDPEFDKEVLQELNRFKSTDQYEAVIMQQKLPWAQYLVALSAIRNINKMNMKPYQMRKAMTSPNLDQSMIKHLSVFNGIKALACFYVIFASSFLFTWYAYLADPSQVTQYKDSYAFLIVYCVYFTAPVLFLAAGFLQTFSFMQQEDMFTAKNLLKYYAWRIFKFVPLLAMVLIFSLFVLPFLGSGPIWSTYSETVMAPCNSNWWTVLAQVNNIYPVSSFDDKCMPWAWFIPALTQLSLLLPIFVGTYQFLMPNVVAVRIFVAAVILLCCAIQAGLTGLYNKGAMPVSILDVATASGQYNSLTTLDFSFYNDVFMLSPFHLSSYFFGFGLAIVYRRYLSDSIQNKQAEASQSYDRSQDFQISRASRFFVLLSENSKIRYAGYVIGGVLIIGTCSWVYPFMAHPEAQETWHTTLFSLAAPTLFLLGFSCFLLPALVGKAALFRSVLGCGMFLIVSNLAATMCLVGPQICLWYYLSSGHTLDISWYVTQYYFDSNVVFTFLISILVAAISDKPFYSLIHLKQDAKIAEEHLTHSIAQYKASSILRTQHGSMATNRYVDVPDDYHTLLRNTTDFGAAAGQPNNGEKRVSQVSRSNRERTTLLANSDETGADEIDNLTQEPQMLQAVTQGARSNTADFKAGKGPSPDTSNHSNRITALDDMMNGGNPRDRSTRGETGLLRETGNISGQFSD